MYRKLLLNFVIVLLLLTSTTIARADGPDVGFAWNNHGGKYDVTFENLIDTHQQTRKSKNGQLQGYIYVQFTGEMI